MGQKRWGKRGSTRDHERPRKRYREDDDDTSGIEMQQLFRHALVLRPAQCTFDMNSNSERERMAAVLWSKQPLLGEDSLSTANGSLAAVLEVLQQNTYRHVPDPQAHAQRKAFRLEGLLSNLQRAQSQKQMTLMTARLSIAAARCQMHGVVWRAVSLLAPGILASKDWTEDFIEFARDYRPPCEYEALQLVGGVMFDNYTRRVLYSSQATVEAGGYLLHMTNSASFTIPRIVAGPNFDANQLCALPLLLPLPSPPLPAALPSPDCAQHPDAGKRPFKRISVGAFSTQFLISSPQIIANKEKRFTSFLLATAAGTLFARPNVQPQYTAHLTYHEPMWGVLQSSYDDVEAELNQLRSYHLDKRILFVGGDGLSILRINHLLYKHPDLYLDSAPMIIPVQGEAPHGVFHVMHGGWRLFRRFIRVAADATLGQDRGKAVVDEPTVKLFNTQIYALWWMTRACSEYLNMLARSPGAIDIDQVPEFIRTCERNIDLAWVVHFLYDFAYLVLDFKQGVRKCASTHLDLLWREFFATGYTGTANKTNYIPMSIMRVFWADALEPQLASLYHALRAIPMSQRVYVGWDSPIEWLNGAITDGVKSLVSEERIQQFVANYSFMNSNYSALLDAIEVARPGSANMREMDGNVDRMKGWLIRHVGNDWATATRQNAQSQLGIGGRGVPPWQEMRTAMTRPGDDAVPAFVARKVRNLTNSFYTFLP